MINEIKLGTLVDRMTEGAETFDEYESGRSVGCSLVDCTKSYSLAGRKIHYLEITSCLGSVAGMLGIAGIFAGIISCLLGWSVEGTFPHLMAAAVGGTSAGLIVVGFGVAAVLFYLAKKERNKMVSSDQIKSILERENRFNKHPRVLRNINTLLEEYDIELKAPSHHMPLLSTPAKLWDRDAEVVL